MAEFTGERVIPGKVDVDLLNEHVARYAFAARLAAGRRVLDAGCGSGYGSAKLGVEAREVLGIDVSQEAVDYAREHYQAPNLRFERADCLGIPAAAGSFDLVVAFEIIEHLNDWRGFLAEVRRVLAPEGRLVVSTPNRLYYAEARAELGPNPFHVHEFEFHEFRAELESVFPHVALYLENHTDAIVFTEAARAGSMEAALDEVAATADNAHFFVAVCGVSGDPAIPGLTYVPRAANMLRERERHIELLESELRQRIARVVQLQDELATEQAQARERIDQVERELSETVENATRLAGELDGKVAELGQCVEYLHASERTVEERTAWARRNEAEADDLRRRLQALWSTRWLRLGFKLRIVPKPESGK
ncbi:MAG: methyltransferase domain-containing protein [Acidobacteriia bacterium]|nr:methyltransferase domain-containing protein [Terriglobia bacterium]